MKKFLRGKKGQNTAEYAILIALVIAAVVGMRTYAQRGIQGRFKDTVDALATDTSDATLGDFALPTDDKYEQYEPSYQDSSYTVTRDTGVTTEFGTEGAGGKKAAKKTIQDGGDSTTRSGSQTFIQNW